MIYLSYKNENLIHSYKVIPELPEKSIKRGAADNKEKTNCPGVLPFPSL